MRCNVSIVLSLVTAAFILAASAEPPITEPSQTNAPPPILIKTNIVDHAGGKHTNVTYLVRQPEGTYTNINVAFRLGLPDGTYTNIVLQFGPNTEDEIHRAIADALPGHLPDQLITPPLGDFWLPGEFEKLRKEREQQRREKAQ